MLHEAPVRRCLTSILWVVCFAAALCSSLPAAPQTPAKLAGGSVRTIGTVRIDGVPAAAEQTVFFGESVSTGADGAALARLPGIELIVSAKSEAVFSPDGRSVLLKRGSFSARSLEIKEALELKFSNSSLLPLEPDSSFLIGVRTDGAAWIECHAGRGVVQRPGGHGAINLRPGDRLGILADGTIENGPPPDGAPGANSADPPAAQKPNRRKVPLWAYGAGAGAAVAGAVVALTHSKGTTGTSSNCPMSPSNFSCQ